MDIEKSMFMIILANFTSAASSRLRSLRLILNIWSRFSKSLTFSKWPRFSLARFSEPVEEEVEVEMSIVDLASRASLRIAGISVLENGSMIIVKIIIVFLIIIMVITMGKCVTLSDQGARK